MNMTSETPSDPLHMSAPTSPRRIKEGLCFLSASTSPTRRRSTLKTWDANSSNSSAADEFEFETSCRFNVVDEYKVISDQPKLHQNDDHVRREISLPAMAFADELFADGKVMPLKPPPRLQYPEDKKISSTLSSPRSPNGLLRLPFHRSRSLWNDDFDPFMVALENVKDDKNHRSRSMSPFRETEGPTGTQSEPNLNSKMSISSFPMWDTDQVKPVKKRSLTLAEPKGVVFARRARLVKPTSMAPTPTVEAGESAKEGGINCSKETKSQKIINFVLRSGSMRKNEDKPKIKTKSSNAKDTRLTMGLTNQYNEGKRVSEMNRFTLLQYRPKMLVCMGYGAKHVH